MLRDLLIGSSIILVPLGLLIVTIALDLDLKQKQLLKRIKKLNILAHSIAKDGAKDLDLFLNRLELDKQDIEQFLQVAGELKIKGSKNISIRSSLIEDYVNAAKRVSMIRCEERLLLNKKLKYFKIYSAVAYILIWASLGILPLLSVMGFTWGWK